MLSGWAILAAFLAGPRPTSFEDLRRFPPSEYALHCRQFAMAYRAKAEERRDHALSPREMDREWETWREACYCYECWDALVDAQRNELERLCQLRYLIGEEAWAAGQMPSPAPWHRFKGR